MTSSQKKWFSLALAVALVALASILTGCGNKEAEQAEAQKKAEAAAASAFMHQGNGKVRKWGESGFVGFSSKDAKPAGSSAAASNEASNAKK